MHLCHLRAALYSLCKDTSVPLHKHFYLQYKFGRMHLYLINSIWYSLGILESYQETHTYLFLSSSVHHAYLYLHAGLAGSYSLHLPASLHVLQHLEHLSEHHTDGKFQHLLWPTSVRCVSHLRRHVFSHFSCSMHTGVNKILSQQNKIWIYG